MRAGDWMQIYSGRRFWPLDPRPEDVTIEDIAHALSMICRYNGHVRRFYSVAEHSLLLCQVMTEREPQNIWHQIQALMHDAAEAYLCDLPRPLKNMLPDYALMEKRVEDVIRQRFGLLCSGKTDIIDEIDGLILYDEAKALLPRVAENWHERFAPGLGVEIVGFPPALAESAFLDAFYQRYEPSVDAPAAGGTEGSPGAHHDPNNPSCGCPGAVCTARRLTVIHDPAVSEMVVAYLDEPAPDQGARGRE